MEFSSFVARRLSLHTFFLACVLAAVGCDSGTDAGGDGGSSNDDAAASSTDDPDAGSTGPGSAGSGRAGSGSSSGGSGGGAQDAGAGASGGNGANAGSGSAEPEDAGSTASMTGPGIPTEGETLCLHENTDLAAAFYFGTQKNCTIYKAVSGQFTDMQKMGIEYLCTSNGGTVVASCPDDPIAAYCAGTEYLPGIMSESTKIIYESAVNPDAAAVAKNSLAVCAGLSAYDTDDHLLEGTCTGTLKAKVDGTAVDFSDQLICSFRTDGEQAVYFVTGTFDPKSIDAKTFSLRIRDDGTGPLPFTEALQPPFGYLEGSGASGAFTTPAADPAPSYESTRFDMDGGGFAGAFEVTINGGGGSRVFTDGEIDLTLSVK